MMMMLYGEEVIDVVDAMNNINNSNNNNNNPWMIQQQPVVSSSCCLLPSNSIMASSQSFRGLPEMTLQPILSSDLDFLTDSNNSNPQCFTSNKPTQTQETLTQDYRSGNERDRDTQLKRSRHEVHSISERRRRSRINGKLKTLQQLMPHCKKKDRASVLDEAAKYIRVLQQQLEVMTKLKEVQCAAQSQYMSTCSMNPGVQQ